MRVLIYSHPFYPSIGGLERLTGLTASYLSSIGHEVTVVTANLIICHAGTGTLLHTLQSGNIPIVMPRRKKYGEASDDHQVELVKILAVEGRIIPAYEIDELPSAIEKAKKLQGQFVTKSSSGMKMLVAHAIKELIG